jgi:hypothetical protein
VHVVPIEVVHRVKKFTEYDIPDAEVMAVLTTGSLDDGLCDRVPPFRYPPVILADKVRLRRGGSLCVHPR